MDFSNKTIMIVDDVIENIKVAMGHLQELNVKFVYAMNGKQALKRIEKTIPDLILMDVMMPEMDGYQTTTALKAISNYKNIPVIFVTAKTEMEDLQKGFEVGGVDYITKPVNSIELLSRVKMHLELSTYRYNLETEVEKKTSQVEKLQASIVEAMGSLAEYRDNETGEHIKRTQRYIKILCKELATHEKYKSILTDDYIELLFNTAPLHDIGKVGICDNILLKPGALTKEEFDLMKNHSSFGEAVINKIIRINGKSDFLECAKEIAGGHHEKWDGSGYPRGLKGENIPLSARLMAVADVYDALISKRVYKDPIPHEKAVEIMIEGKGTHFDPLLIEIFEQLESEFKNISQKYLDN